MIKILTEPNKTLREIAKEYKIRESFASNWIRNAGLYSERKKLVNSYRDSKVRLVRAISEYPEKGLEEAASDNDVSKTTLAIALGKLSDNGEIVLQKTREERASHQKKLNLMQAYYEGKDLEDLCKIFNGNEKDTKQALGGLVYLTLSNEEEKELLTEYSGLIKDSREALLTPKGRIDKWGVSKVKDYLVTYIARTLAIKIKKARKERRHIEESNWWSEEFDPDSKGEDWWDNESELDYKTAGEVPKEIREKMVELYNEGNYTRKGVAKFYKTKRTTVRDIFDSGITNNVINKRVGRGDLEEVTLALLTESPDAVKTKYGFKDRIIRDRLTVIDYWRKLSDDQKNAFKKAIKTKEMPDLSAVEYPQGKRICFINDNFEKNLFALVSKDEEIIEKYYKNASVVQKKDNVRRLRQKTNIWTILAEQEIDLIQAVKDENLKKVKNLIEKKINANCKDEYLQTPLMWAVTLGNADIVRYLIRHGADISHKDNNNETALIIARNFGHDEIVNILRSVR